MRFIPAVVLNDAFLPFAIVLVAAVAAFLIIQTLMGHRARANMLRDLLRSQEELYSRTAEELAVRLTEYTDNILLEKVDRAYSSLISKELLPGVDQAARVTAELSAAVVSRQEHGMAELAAKLSATFTEELRRYVRDEARLISEARGSTEVFTEKLGAAAASVEQTSARYAEIFQKTSAVYYALLETSNSFGRQITDLTELLGKTANAFEHVRSTMEMSGELTAGLGDAAAEMRKSSMESAQLLANQNERVATLLGEAVFAMQVNTERSAKALLTEFGRQIAGSAASTESSVQTLREISAAIKDTAEQFARSISESGERLSSGTDGAYQRFAKQLSEASREEYERFTTGSAQFSGKVLSDIARLGETLDGHISNLYTVTQQLGNSVASFHGDVSASTMKFEMGMEKSIEAALHQMDLSLAEIIKRLVSVTANIEDAAGALPRAVQAIAGQND